MATCFRGTGFRRVELRQNIGYGLSLRGYTEDEHGRDISYFIDGFPINQISSIHTPNYADLNVLLPIGQEHRYRARAFFGLSRRFQSWRLHHRHDQAIGAFRQRGRIGRLIRHWARHWDLRNGQAPVTPSPDLPYKAPPPATYESSGVLPFTVWLGEEFDHADGYRDNSEVDHYNSFNKITLPQADGSSWSIRAQAYGSTFGAPGYIEKDAIVSGALSPRAATDRTDGGDTYQENLVVNYTNGVADQELTAVLFADHNTFDRFSNFSSTVCTSVPCNGQSLQHDEREMIGGRVQKVWTGAFADTLPVQLTAGTYWRTDFINTYAAPTTSRVQTGGDTTDLGINETNLAGYTQLQVKPLSWVKLTGAARYDQFYYDVTNRLDPTLQPDVSPGIWQPKAGISITPLTWLEPLRKLWPGFPQPGRGDGTAQQSGIEAVQDHERGNRHEVRFDRFAFTADVWTTNSENEAFQPAPGLPTTFLGAARRDGFDLDGRYFFFRDTTGSFSLFANYGAVQALLLNAAPSQFVPDVPVYVSNVGVDFDVPTRNGQRFSGETYVSFIGKKYMTQDGLITTSPYRASPASSPILGRKAGRHSCKRYGIRGISSMKLPLI